MFFDFLKKRSRVVDVKIEGEKGKIEKKHTWLIVVIITAIAILAFTDFDKPVPEVKTDEEIPITVTTDDRIAETEDRLKRMISTIKGAGNVHVMVVFESNGEKIPATNKISQKDVENQGDVASEKISSEENIILFGSGSEEKPYVLKEKMPVPNGVFISATGASNENVKLEIYEAVKALYGISGHRIKVSSAEK